MLNFPGSSSKQMLHSIDIHLEDKSIDTTFFHVSVSELWNNNSQSNVDNLISNIHKIVQQSKQVEVRNILLSGLVYTKRLKLPMLERVHALISNYCRENACFYIDNKNNRGFCLYKDCLYLLGSRKKVLANNFNVNLNNFFLEAHTQSTNIFKNNSDLWRTSSHTTHLQLLHHERLKHNNNPMRGYLNIKSLQNKLTDLWVTLNYVSLDYFVLKLL